MKFLSRSVPVLIALAAVSAFASDDIVEYAGQALQPDQGLVILRAEWRRETKGAASKVMTRDDDKLSFLIKSAEPKNRAKFVLKDPGTVRAFVLPAGRWYLAEMRTPSKRDFPTIAKPLQSFQVVADKINYAGLYTIEIESGDEGRLNASVGVDFGPDLVREATDAFPDAFAAHQLLYCPVGRLCKPPSEFKQ